MLKVGLRPASALFNYKARHSDPLSHSGTEGIAVPAKAIAAAFALQPRHGLDAYWPLALLTACALALAGCSTGSHALDSRTQAEAQARATEEAKPPLERGIDATVAGDLKAAAEFFRQAHEQNPQAAEALRCEGEAQVAVGDYTAAYQTYHDLQVLAPDDPEAAFRLGELMIMRGSPQAAIDQLTIALAKRQDDPALYSTIGVAYSMMGKYDQAIANYHSGLKLVPGHMGLLNNLGMAQFLAGDFNGAVTTLTGLVALPNAKPSYRRNLAFVYAVHGDLAKAREVAGQDIDLAALDADLATYKKLADMPGEGVDRALMGIRFSRSAADAEAAAPQSAVAAAPSATATAQNAASINPTAHE